MDQIHIRDLRLRTRLGLRDWEQEKRHDVVINLTIHFDATAAGMSDDVADTVDYKTIKDQVVAHVEAAQIGLIEKMAADIAAICLAIAGVQHVDVTVDKPGALRFADSVAVTIHR